VRLSRRRRRSATCSRSCTTSSRDRPRPAQYDVIEFICGTTAPRRSTRRRQRLVCACLRAAPSKVETAKARCPGGVQEHHVSRALVRRRARPRRLPAGALCGAAGAAHQIDLVILSHTRFVHATSRHPEAAVLRRWPTDGPCIFNLPKKARFAAEHGLYVDGDLAGSELDVSTL